MVTATPAPAQTTAERDKRQIILDATLKRHQYRQDALIEALHTAQNLHGFLTPELLREKGLVTSDVRVKVLARGEIGKALTVRAHKFSGKAAEKIAAAGGTAEVLG